MTFAILILFIHVCLSNLIMTTTDALGLCVCVCVFFFFVFFFFFVCVCVCVCVCVLQGHETFLSVMPMDEGEMYTYCPETFETEGPPLPSLPDIIQAG